MWGDVIEIVNLDGKYPKKLIDVRFNKIPVNGLSIFIEDEEVASGYIGEVLEQVPHLADYEIKSTNYYFDTFVIRLKGNN